MCMCKGAGAGELVRGVARGSAAEPVCMGGTGLRNWGAGGPRQFRENRAA